MASVTELPGTVAFTPIYSGWLVTRATGKKSFNVSYGSFGCSVGLMACCVTPNRSVYPSGAAFATTSVPTIALVPARFSTMMFRPRSSDSFAIV
jgi:hypothetical protein